MASKDEDKLITEAIKHKASTTLTTNDAGMVVTTNAPAAVERQRPTSTGSEPVVEAPSPTAPLDERRAENGAEGGGPSPAEATAQAAKAARKVDRMSVPTPAQTPQPRKVPTQSIVDAAFKLTQDIKPRDTAEGDEQGAQREENRVAEAYAAFRQQVAGENYQLSREIAKMDDKQLAKWAKEQNA